MQSCKFYIGKACASYPCPYSRNFDCSSCPENKGCIDCIFFEDLFVCPLLAIEDIARFSVD